MGPEAVDEVLAKEPHVLSVTDDPPGQKLVFSGVKAVMFFESEEELKRFLGYKDTALDLYDFYTWLRNRYKHSEVRTLGVEQVWNEFHKRVPSIDNLL